MFTPFKYRFWVKSPFFLVKFPVSFPPKSAIFPICAHFLVHEKISWKSLYFSGWIPPEHSWVPMVSVGTRWTSVAVPSCRASAEAGWGFRAAGLVAEVRELGVVAVSWQRFKPKALLVDLVDDEFSMMLFVWGNPMIYSDLMGFNGIYSDLMGY